jgi:hypothetical protein
MGDALAPADVHGHGRERIHSYECQYRNTER